MIDRDALREECDRVLEAAADLPPDSEEHKRAVESYKTLCEIELKYDELDDNELFKERELEQNKENFKIKLIAESGLAILGKLVNGYWMAKGYAIETTGSITTPIFKSLMNGVVKNT